MLKANSVVSLAVLGLLAFVPRIEASERTEADFIAACTANSNLSPAVCACSAGKARGELTPDGFSLVVATLEGNDAAAAQLRGKLPIDQLMKAGTFMTRAPAQCAKASESAG